MRRINSRDALLSLVSGIAGAIVYALLRRFLGG